jgi:hypothetical protein
MYLFCRNEHRSKLDLFFSIQLMYVQRRRGMRCVLVTILLLTLVAPLFAQHGLAGREQWQPQNTTDGRDPDARLEKPVTIATAGHSAVTTLKALTKLTGVALEVAPEDLATVGERKLVIYAENKSLKSLMVQIPEALRECHWDIILTGEKPSYLLHRNADMATTIAQLSQQRKQWNIEIAQAVRAMQVEELRQLLALPPEEMKQISEPLAKALADPYAHAIMEVFVAVPQENLDKFVETGELEIDFTMLSPQLREQTEKLSTRQTLISNGKEYMIPEAAQTMSAAINKVISAYWNTPEAVFFAEGDAYISYSIGANYTNELGLQSGAWLGMGTPLAAVKSSVVSRPAGKFRDSARWLLQEGAGGGQSSTDADDPQLQKMIQLKTTSRVNLAQIQRLIGEKSGLTVISDYFEASARPLPASTAADLPLGQLLDVVAAQWNCYWHKTGDCLIFYHANWFDLIDTEIPAALIETYQQKLKAQGQFTLADAAAFRHSLGNRLYRGNVPDDLSKAGLWYSYNDWALLLYVSLSPAQIAKANNPAGLAFTELTTAQQQQLEANVNYINPAFEPGFEFTPDPRLKSACYHIVKSSDASGTIKYTITLTRAGDRRPMRSSMFIFPKRSK